MEGKEEILITKHNTPDLYSIYDDALVCCCFFFFNNTKAWYLDCNLIRKGCFSIYIVSRKCENYSTYG